MVTREYIKGKNLRVGDRIEITCEFKSLKKGYPQLGYFLENDNDNLTFVNPFPREKDYLEGDGIPKKLKQTISLGNISKVEKLELAVQSQ